MGVGSGRYALGPGRGTAARTGEESASSSEVGKRKQYVYDLEKARWLKLLYYLKPLWFILCISSDMWLQSFISCLIEVVPSQYLFMYHRHLSFCLCGREGSRQPACLSAGVCHHVCDWWAQLSGFRVCLAALTPKTSGPRVKFSPPTTVWSDSCIMELPGARTWCGPSKGSKGPR